MVHFGIYQALIVCLSQQKPCPFVGHGFYTEKIFYDTPFRQECLVIDFLTPLILIIKGRLLIKARNAGGHPSILLSERFFWFMT